MKISRINKKRWWGLMAATLIEKDSNRVVSVWVDYTVESDYES